jgi:hypothetical protein
MLNERGVAAADLSDTYKKNECFCIPISIKNKNHQSHL